LDGDVQAGGAGDSAALVALDPARRHAFVIANFPSTSPSRVSLIDTGTGAILRTTNVGPDNAFHIAVAAVRHRAFVAALNSRTYGCPGPIPARASSTTRGPLTAAA